MAIYKLKLIDRQEIVPGIVIFTFEKPANFIFKPGQYGGFTLINPSITDAGGITRRFSILSSPDDDALCIATRIQNSAYKKELLNLSIQGEIKFAGPTGLFTLHEDQTKPAVLIAGGIGIAPFYSMIRYAAAHQLPQAITLFYGNQNLKTTAFIPELMSLEKNNSLFKMIATMAEPENDWQGEKGFITDKMIRQYVPDLAAPIYYICGSPTMVTTLQETLAEMGVNEDNIRVEDFPGY